MANNSTWLLNPYPYPVNASNNSFVSSWGDKRSGQVTGLSLVMYGANAPDGYAAVETSSAPDQPGTNGGFPNNQGDDAMTFPGSTQTLVLNATTGLYTVRWDMANIGSRWVRVRYTATTNKTGLTANVYVSSPFTSTI